jgi:hypothetical protein
MTSSSSQSFFFFDTFKKVKYINIFYSINSSQKKKNAAALSIAVVSAMGKTSKYSN